MITAPLPPFKYELSLEPSVKIFMQLSGTELITPSANLLRFPGSSDFEHGSFSVSRMSEMPVVTRGSYLWGDCCEIVRSCRTSLS